MSGHRDPFDLQFDKPRANRADEFAELESSFLAASGHSISRADAAWDPVRLFSPSEMNELREPGELNQRNVLLDPDALSDDHSLYGHVSPSAAAHHALGSTKASIDAIGPNMGHFAMLFVLSAIFLVLSQFGSLFAMHKLQILGHHSLRAYAEMMAGDARWLVPTEALGYLLVLAFAVPLFRWLWERPFSVGIHWNFSVARSHVMALLLAGLGSGFGIGVLGSVLPMPKNPPIMADMLHSPLGAWLMFAFGVTGAPLFEEFFFRGFLLPAFLNAFRWLSLKGDLSPRAALWLGVPVSFLLTSLPFALLHAPQVSHAWGPILLIGIVSVVLCAVRFRFNSLAASTLVHSAYNFTLFAGILFQTGGFRHLDRLAQ
jgi:membrane protease YdiL (CAAX protease family)